MREEIVESIATNRKTNYNGRRRERAREKKEREKGREEKGNRGNFRHNLESTKNPYFIG